MGTDDSGSAVGLPDAQPVERRQSTDLFLMRLDIEKLKDNVGDLHDGLYGADGALRYLRELSRAQDDPEKSIGGRILLEKLRDLRDDEKLNTDFRLKFEARVDVLFATARAIMRVAAAVALGLGILWSLRLLGLIP